MANTDPADGNLATVQQTAEQETPPAPASAQSYAPPTGDYPSDYAQDSSYQQPVQASEPPPPLPDYSQPPAPGDNYIWTPGYWDYANAGYYWVPGAWVLAPWVDALWTPPWWGYDNGAYLWHAGYWGPHIGYYGGIDYGFGYTGRGYYGAYWNHGSVYYNRSVTNVNPSVVHNVYNYAVSNNRGNRVSYNGGRGGVDARPTKQELAVLHDPRTPPVAAQVQHAREASSNRAQFAKSGGNTHPAALVAERPLATSYKAPQSRPPAAAMRAAARPAPETQANRTPENRAVPQTRPQAQAGRPTQRAETPEARPEARPQAHPEAQPRQAPVARAQTRPEARPEPRPQARPQPAQPRPEARPQARPEPRPEARPEARPQARPEPRPAARPQEAARPQPRPAAAPRPAPKPKEEQKDRK